MDRHGNSVRVGDKIRVVEIPKDIYLDDDEVEDVNSMLGGIFVVQDIDKYGCAEITKWWDGDDGIHASHSLSLSPHEMELVTEGDSEA